MELARRSRFALVLALLAACALPAVLAAQPAAVGASSASDPWAGWRFLAGDWTGEESTTHGTGAFSFRFELDDHALVRRNHGTVPATGHRAAIQHDDLMVVYAGGAGSEPAKKEALYVDNEGHVIHYTAEAAADGKSITFLTAPSPDAPRFRLTYTKLSESDLDIRFEIAPPGSPDQFRPYLTGKGKRATAAKPK